MAHCDMITEDMEMLAKAMGWKNIFFKFYYKQEHGNMACPAEEEDKANTASPWAIKYNSQSTGQLKRSQSVH